MHQHFHIIHGRNKKKKKKKKKKHVDLTTCEHNNKFLGEIKKKNYFLENFYYSRTPTIGSI